MGSSFEPPEGSSVKAAVINFPVEPRVLLNIAGLAPLPVRRQPLRFDSDRWFRGARVTDAVSRQMSGGTFASASVRSANPRATR